MKLSFSTRGWRNLPWQDQVRDASEMRFQGVEVYNLHRCTSLTAKGGAFERFRRNETLRELRENNLVIPCLDTSINLGDPGEDISPVDFLLDTAASMHIPYLAFCALTDDENLIRERIMQLLPAAQDKKICLLIKTVGIYANTERLRLLLDSYASDYLAALWDMHHPFRDFHEKPDTTIRNLGGYVRHVHLRDSDDNLQYNLIGEGTIPVQDMMNALYSIDYSGFISLEWKPEWIADIPDREIIFSHFLNYMNRFENPKGKKKSLYFNHDGTGKFVWKKDELIDLTFGQVLDRMVEEFPDQYAFKYTTLDYIRTYAEFRDDVDRFARALISLGVRTGTKVAIWPPTFRHGI